MEQMKNNSPQDKASNSLWFLLPDAIKYCVIRTPIIPILLIAALLSLSGCERENLNDKPVSYWINDSDSCVSGTAQAIVDSGLPYPNFHYETIIDPKTGKEKRRRIALDMWLGTERYVIPIEYAYYNGGYAKSHPYRYMGLRGSLPNFYPKGPRAGVKDGMASMVNVRFQCSMKQFYVDSWGKGSRSNEDGITAFTARMQKRSDRMNKQFETTRSQVFVSVRKDLGMTEVLWDRYADRHGNREGLHGGWEAAYWPLENNMVSFDGAISGIACKIRHDPIKKRYGKSGWRCGSALRVNKNTSAKIEIYVSHLAEMPNIHQQVKQLLIDSKQPLKD